MSIAPLIDPLCSALLIVGVSATTTEASEALDNLGNQDLGSTSAEPETKRIAKAITGKLLLDLVCIFVQSPFLHLIVSMIERKMGYNCIDIRYISIRKFKDKRGIFFDSSPYVKDRTKPKDFYREFSG